MASPDVKTQSIPSSSFQAAAAASAAEHSSPLPAATKTAAWPFLFGQRFGPEMARTSTARYELGSRPSSACSEHPKNQEQSSEGHGEGEAEASGRCACATCRALHYKNLEAFISKRAAMRKQLVAPPKTSTQPLPSWLLQQRFIGKMLGTQELCKYTAVAKEWKRKCPHWVEVISTEEVSAIVQTICKNSADAKGAKRAAALIKKILSLSLGLAFAKVEVMEWWPEEVVAALVEAIARHAGSLEGLWFENPYGIHKYKVDPVVFAKCMCLCTDKHALAQLRDCRFPNTLFAKVQDCKLGDRVEWDPPFVQHRDRHALGPSRRGPGHLTYEWDRVEDSKGQEGAQKSK